MSIGERILELRTEKGVSQVQIAKALEVSRQAVSKWENDLAAPDTIKLIQLAQLLDTDVEYLATGRIAVPSRPPVVVKTVETVEKIVEKPVIQIQERIVERRVEVPVEVPVVEYVEKPIIHRVFRTQYRRNPAEYALLSIGSFLIGLLIGLLI